MFLTSRGNRDRCDLRCPLGCRVRHRRAESKRRSGLYYKTSEGRLKKKRHNRRRSAKWQSRKPSDQGSTEGAASVIEEDSDLIEYCIEMSGLIDGKPMSRERARELIIRGREAAREQVRQHSLVEDAKSGKVPGG